MKRRIKNGDRVKDIVSGAQGVVIGITEWFTGCDTLVVELPLNADGTKPDSITIDITRAKLIKSEAVTLQPGMDSKSSKSSIDNGGPHEQPARNRSVHQR